MSEAKLKANEVPLGQIDQIILRHLVTPRPLLLWGDPGIGKTQRVRRFCRDLIQESKADIAYLEFSPNSYAEQDVGGYPRLYDDDSFDLVPLRMFKKLSEHQGAIVYIDEINTAHQAMLAALLRLVQERRAGQFQLPPATLFIATANPAQHSVNAQDIGDNLSSRFVHYHVHADLNDFVQNYPSYWGTPRSELANQVLKLSFIDLDKYMAKWEETRSLIASYLRSNPGFFVGKPPESDFDRDRGYPNPRSWDAVACLLATSEFLKIDKGLPASIAGAIGPDAAYSFIRWYTKRAIPSPEEIINNPDGATMPKDRPDMMFATLSNLSNYLIYNISENKNLSQKDLFNMLDAAFRYIERYISSKSTDIDIVSISLRPLWTHLDPRNKNMADYWSKNFAKIDSEVFKIIEEQFSQDERISNEIKRPALKFKESHGKEL